MAEQFKIKSLEDYRKQLSTTSPFKLPKTKEVSTNETLAKQKENLEKRLKAVGVDANDPSDSVVDNRGLIEKALNLTPNQNALFDIFEIIDRPIRAAFSGVNSLIEGENPLEGLWKGLSGQEEVTATDILDNANIINKEELNPVAEFAIDLGAEVFLDPLNLIPSGTLLKPFKMKSEFEIVETTDLIQNINKQLTDDVFTGMSAKEARLLKTQKGYFSKKLGLTIYDDEGFTKLGDLTYSGSAQKQAGSAYERLVASKLNAQFRKAAKDMGLDLYVRKLKTNVAETPDIVFLLKRQIIVDGKPQNYFVKVGDLEVKGVSLSTPGIKQVEATAPRVTISSGKKGGDAFDIEFNKDYIKSYSDVPNFFEDIQKLIANAVNVPLAKGKNKFQPTTLKEYFEQYSKKDAAARKLIKGSKGKKGFTGFQKALSDVGLTKDLIGKKDAASFQTWLYKTLTQSGSRDKLVEKLLAFGSFDANKVEEIADVIMNYRKKFRDTLTSLKLPISSSATIDLTGEREVIANAWKALFKQKFGKYISYADGVTGNVKIFSVDDLLESNGVVFRLGSDSEKIGPESFRIRAAIAENKKFSDLNLKDRTQEQLQEIISNSLNVNKQLGTTEKVADTVKTTKTLVERKIKAPVMLFLDRISESGSIFSKPARYASDLLEKINYTFNKGAGLSGLVKNELSRIEGDVAQTIYREVTDLNKLQDYLEELNPKAASYVRQMLELGIDESFDEIPGFINRTDETLARINYYFRNAEMGKFSVINKFENQAAIRNAEDVFNRVLELNNIEATFKIKTTKSGYQYLDLESDLPMPELKKLLGSDNLIISENLKTFTYGNIKMDDDFREFYRLYKSDMNKIFRLNESYTTKLFDEIGYMSLSTEDINRMGYIRHRLTDEARKAQVENAPAVVSKFTRQGSNLLSPKVYDADIDAVNGVLRDMMELDYDTITTDGFAAVRDQIESVLLVEEQNKVFEAILRETRAIEETGDPQSFFRIIDNTKEAASDLGPSYIVLKDAPEIEFGKMFDNLGDDLKTTWGKYLTELGYEPGKAIAMNRSVHETMVGLNNAYVNVADLVKQYDSFLNFWKSITLVTPGFHVRNVFGNFSNMYIGGMTTPEIFKFQNESFMDFNVYWKNRNRVIEAGGDIDILPEAIREQYRGVQDYYENGVAQTRKGIRDLEKVKNLVLERLDPNSAGYKRAYQQLVRANFNAAELLDDVQRYAMYKWARSDKQIRKLYGAQLDDIIKQGADQKMIDKFKNSVAREKVMNALFDYTNLTSFEKDVMKRFFPFYTFMKNNFIFQAKSLLENPTKFARIGRAYDYWNEDIGGISTEDLPDYARDNMWLPLPFVVSKDDEQAISFLKLNLPASDFGELVSEPFKRGVSSLAAPIKLPIEFAYGRDSFTGQEFQEFPGEQNRLDSEDGVLSFIRDSRGTLAVTSNPYIQKISNELGLRLPKNYLTIALDVVDGIAGFQTGGETLTDLTQRLSLTGTQTQSNLEMTRLYQDLEHLRNLRSLYEQKTGERLPSLDELGLD